MLAHLIAQLAHGGSAIFHSECQIRYTMKGIRELIETGARSIECRRAPYDAYNVKVDAALERMVWSHRAMTNWYKNKRGRVVMNSPWRLVDYRNMTEHMENVFQKYLRNEFELIEEYNTHAGEVAEPYRILIVANFPVGFSERAAQRLVSVMTSGARCGVHMLISVDTG